MYDFMKKLSGMNLILYFDLLFSYCLDKERSEKKSWYHHALHNNFQCSYRPPFHNAVGIYACADSSVWPYPWQSSFNSLPARKSNSKKAKKGSWWWTSAAQFEQSKEGTIEWANEVLWSNYEGTFLKKTCCKWLLLVWMLCSLIFHVVYIIMYV